MLYDNYAPGTGKLIKSDNSIVDEANGIDTDGIRFTKNKANGWTLVATIPYTAFSISTSLYQKIIGVLNPAAKKRAFLIVNTMDVGTSSGMSYFPSDSMMLTGNTSTVQAVNGNLGAAVVTATLGTNPNVSTTLLDSQQYPVIAHSGDSASISFPIGATAPTKGNVLIYMREVI